MVAYYHKLFSSNEVCEKACSECRLGARGCVACKKQLAKNINDTLEPMREKRKYYEQHPELVDEILRKGTEEARKVAKENLIKLKTNMGINYFN